MSIRYFAFAAVLTPGDWSCPNTSSRPIPQYTPETEVDLLEDSTIVRTDSNWRRVWCEHPEAPGLIIEFEVFSPNGGYGGPADCWVDGDLIWFDLHPE